MFVCTLYMRYFSSRMIYILFDNKINNVFTTCQIVYLILITLDCVILGS